MSFHIEARVNFFHLSFHPICSPDFSQGFSGGKHGSLRPVKHKIWREEMYRRCDLFRARAQQLDEAPRWHSIGESLAGIRQMTNRKL